MAESVPGAGVLFQSVGGVAAVTPPVEVDRVNAGVLGEALAVAGRDHAVVVVVVVDMAANEFCDSSGIAELVVAWKRARAGGGEVRLVLGGPAVRRIFKATGVDRVFRIFGSVAEAVAAPPAAAASSSPCGRRCAAARRAWTRRPRARVRRRAGRRAGPGRLPVNHGAAGQCPVLALS